MKQNQQANWTLYIIIILWAIIGTILKLKEVLLISWWWIFGPLFFLVMLVFQVIVAVVVVKQILEKIVEELKDSGNL